MMEAQFENEIKAIIGDCAGLRGDWGKLTWTKNKDSRKIDWEKLAMSLSPSPDQINQFTAIRPGARVFRAYFPKED
jgi:hypothetical protein